jgi:hypothetical protein
VTPTTSAASWPPSPEPSSSSVLVGHSYGGAVITNAIPPAAERFMAKRAHAQTVEVAGSHAVMIAHPKPVADLVRAAADSQGPSDGHGPGAMARAEMRPPVRVYR